MPLRKRICDKEERNTEEEINTEAEYPWIKNGSQNLQDKSAGRRGRCVDRAS